MSISIGIIGATGRMGLELLKSLHAADGAVLGAALAREAHPALGKDANAMAGLLPVGIPVTADLPAALQAVDVAIDFSRAGAAAQHAEACAAAGVALLVGTTGLDVHAQHSLEAAARRVPVLVAANTSLALNVLLELVERAARALPVSYDIEIFETHHRHKVDAPSGTALALGAVAAAGRGEQLPPSVALTGARPGTRPPGGIGFSVARGGDVVGEHNVRFLGTGEQLALSHVATDRAIFARGAIQAATWLAGQPAGRYRMADFLFREQ